MTLEPTAPVSSSSAQEPIWANELRARAFREGWELVLETRGNRRVAVLRLIDLDRAAPLPRELAPATRKRIQDIWTIVARGGEAHHVVARALLSRSDAYEFEQMIQWVNLHGPREPYALAFPSYGPLDVQLPERWKDISSRANPCPVFQCGGLKLFVDYRWPSLRTKKLRSGRFLLLRQQQVLLQTEDWEQMLSAMRRFAMPVLGAIRARLIAHQPSR
jgi:hypothetical protein